MQAPGLEGRDDAVLPFAVEALDVRGRAVRLGLAVRLVERRGRLVLKKVQRAHTITCRGGISAPDRGPKISGMPPTRVATIGWPAAAASRWT